MSITTKFEPCVMTESARSGGVYTRAQYIKNTRSDAMSTIGCRAYVTEMNHGVASPTPSGTFVL